MSQTITVSDELYSTPDAERRQKGFSTIEQLLERTHISEDERRRRQEAFDRVEALQRHLSAKYGKMPDSTELLREDRAR